MRALRELEKEKCRDAFEREESWIDGEVDAKKLEEENEGLKKLLGVSQTRLTLLLEQHEQLRAGNIKRKSRLEMAKALCSRAEGYDANVVNPTVKSLERASCDLEEVAGAERRKRAMQLFELFPLVPREPGINDENTVADVILNLEEGNPKADQEQTILALTLIARVIVVGSHYLKLPIPFRISFDKSGVGFLSHDSGKNALDAYPLIPPPKSQPKLDQLTQQQQTGGWNMASASHKNFYHALRLLHADVTFLCVSQGVPTNVLSNDPKHVVANLWQLFHSASLGRSVRAALEQASTRESVKLTRPVGRMGGVAVVGTAATMRRKKFASAGTGKRKLVFEADEDDFVVIGVE